MNNFFNKDHIDLFHSKPFVEIEYNKIKKNISMSLLTDYKTGNSLQERLDIIKLAQFSISSSCQWAKCYKFWRQTCSRRNRFLKFVSDSNIIYLEPIVKGGVIKKLK